MKILLLAKVPSYFRLISSEGSIFPPFQAQTFWIKGLESLRHRVSVFLYSKPVFLPAKLSAHIDVYLQRQIPVVYGKVQNLLAKVYRWVPTNYLRSIHLNNHIARFKPEIIIIAGGANGLTIKPLKIAHNLGIKIYLLHGEEPSISATSFEKDLAPLTKAVIVNDPAHIAGWKKNGAHSVVALPYSGIDPDFHRAADKKRSIPLVFIGTLLRDRQSVLIKLRKYQPRIYGYIPPAVGLDPLLKPFYHGEIWGAEMVAILQLSQIALNFSPPHMPIGGNLRTFEIPACGALQITNHCPSTWFKPNKEIVIYSNTNDLISKIAYYLTDHAEREKVAAAGYRRVHREYTYQNRFKEILSL